MLKVGCPLQSLQLIVISLKDVFHHGYLYAQFNMPFILLCRNLDFFWPLIYAMSFIALHDDTRHTYYVHMYVTCKVNVWEQVYTSVCVCVCVCVLNDPMAYYQRTIKLINTNLFTQYKPQIVLQAGKHTSAT